MSAPAPRRMFLYPDPVRAPNVPQRKDGGPNPRIYGWCLVAAAFFMENVGFIRRAAWKNAKFGSLRDIWDYIVTVEPRHDPAVFPLIDDASHAEVKPADHSDLEGILDQHLDQNQFARKSSMFPNTAAYYRSQYLSGELTPLDVAHAILPLIRRDTSPPGEHSVAWIEVHAELVLRAAEASTIRYNEKRSLGPLDGVPTAVKDDLLGVCQNWRRLVQSSTASCHCTNLAWIPLGTTSSMERREIRTTHPTIRVAARQVVDMPSQLASCPCPWEPMVAAAFVSLHPSVPSLDSSPLTEGYPFTRARITAERLLCVVRLHPTCAP
ncbi:hypothetical protein HYQ46_006929 [Verticillium longisporum]|nr:hypothetical protein HYQ46_006929 [Verticillium longisporum]